MTNSYIVVTAHTNNSISKDFMSLLLALKVVNEKHSGENVKNNLIEILNSYDLTFNNISKVLTDNASNMIKAFKLLCNDEYENSKSVQSISVENEINLDEENDINWESEDSILSQEIYDFEEQEFENKIHVT